MDEEEIFADHEDHIDYLTRGADFLYNYSGWFLFTGVILLGIYWPKIQRYFDSLYAKYEARRYDAKYHKNPDLALERLEGMQLARKKMQEELDRKAKEYEEKRKEKEKQKLLEKLAKIEEKEGGNKLGNSPSTSSSNSTFRQDYNPLMGDTSRGYRAPRRSGCPGGGCG